MKKLNIGVLHPGEMGISIAASAQDGGSYVYWVSKNRSPQTRRRAEEHHLIEIHSLKELCATCSIIFCVCPPHAAENMAKEVIENEFSGIYVDANAISPHKARRIGLQMESSGVNFIDGGIIGGPAWKPKSTWLYLSGINAEVAADCFANGPLETEVIGGSPGKASALKMCYAAYSKGTSALLCAILATAESLGVRGELNRQWSYYDSDFADNTAQRVRRVTAKAWRFTGEMDEISETFIEAGLPGGFHQAAAEVYRRIAKFKEASPIPALDEVLEALIDG